MSNDNSVVYAKGVMDMFLEEGQQVYTDSFNLTSPFPRVDISTNRKAIMTIKRVQAWLVSNAIQEAEKRHDDFNYRIFCSYDLKNLSTADLDSAELYLFGGVV